MRLRARRDARPGNTLVYLTLLVSLVLSVFPLYWLFVVATRSNDVVGQMPPPLVPGGNLGANVRRLFGAEQANFALGLFNSAVASIAVTVSVVFFSSLAGFAFAKLRFRGKTGLLVFVIATMAVPTQLGVVPLFIAMSQLHLAGTLGAVILPAIVSAFGVFWMTQYMATALPSELVEAARVDGASIIRTFWSIALPAARPAAAMLGLFIFIATWTNFFWPFIVLDRQNPTLPVALSLLSANYFVDYSVVLAGVILSTIPLLILFIVAGKQLVSGIMQGAVKG
jgi:cellobiose transport system permease protein